MKHLLNRTILSLLLLAGVLPATAQPNTPPKAERLREIQAQKSAYITAQLQLTPEEAQRFWPVYNEFDEKQDALRKEMRSLINDPQGDKEPSESDAAAILEKGLQQRHKEIDLERSYLDRFKQSIGAVKTLRLRKAEHDFNREVLRKFRHRGEEGPPPPRRP